LRKADCLRAARGATLRDLRFERIFGGLVVRGVLYPTGEHFAATVWGISGRSSGRAGVTQVVYTDRGHYDTGLSGRELGAIIFGRVQPDEELVALLVAGLDRIRSMQFGESSRSSVGESLRSYVRGKLDSLRKVPGHRDDDPSDSAILSEPTNETSALGLLAITLIGVVVGQLIVIALWP
jgi:hypothetical protein